MRWWTKKSLEKEINGYLKDQDRSYMMNICVDPDAQLDYYLVISDDSIVGKLDIKKYSLNVDDFIKTGQGQNCKVLLESNSKSKIINYILNNVPKLPIKTESWITIKKQIKEEARELSEVFWEYQKLNRNLNNLYKELGKIEQEIETKLQGKNYIEVDIDNKEKEDTKYEMMF